MTEKKECEYALVFSFPSQPYQDVQYESSRLLHKVLRTYLIVTHLR